MSIIGWIILGLLSGFIASKIVNKTGQGLFLDLVLGIVGAIVCGVIFSALGASGITGLNLYSMVVAVIEAVLGRRCKALGRLRNVSVGLIARAKLGKLVSQRRRLNRAAEGVVRRARPA